MTACALIIDDEPDIRELVTLTITRMGLDCHSAGNLVEAGNLLKLYHFDVCLTDMKLPDGNGVDFVSTLKQTHPDLPVAVVTAHGDMHAAIDAMKNGAYDFVSKPVDINQLRRLVTTAIAQSQRTANDHKHNNPQQSESTANLQDSLCADTTSATQHDLIGESAEMKDLKQMIRKLAQTNAPVWISGESGTGKELTAKMIHQHSGRNRAPFFAINCGAIPAELMESELFGHKKGSFTGAVSDHKGIIAQAEGGTLLLDEVADLPLSMQVKLLRTLQEKSIRPIGSANEIPVDVRFLSASHKDLAQEVAAGRFRHDLFYRLNVIGLTCPALRERKVDIPLLTQHILGSVNRRNPDRQYQFTQAAVSRLQAYEFPGNVRELENIIERTIAIADSVIIDESDLQIDSHSSASQTKNIIDMSDWNQQHLGDQANSNQSSLGTAHLHQTPLPKTINHAFGIRDSDDDIVKQQIVNALNRNRWNRKAAARELGLTYRQLRYRIDQLGLNQE